MIIIFSYNRPDMLAKVIEQAPIKPYVIDDGSSFDCMPFVRSSYFHRLEHNGKEGYYLNWQYALDICEHSDEDFFLFIPDDFLNVDYKRIEKIYSSLYGKYAYNLLNDGRPECWTDIKHKEQTINGVDSIMVSYCDCGYFTNRATLKAIDFKQDFISPLRFLFPDISSGVGEAQSKKYASLGIPMYCPKKSLCYHGPHKSEMHTELRKKQPLLSK